MAASVALVLLLVAAGCHGPALEQVVLRLGPAEFSPGRVGTHWPVATIGEQSREVVADRDPIAIGTFPAIRFEQGSARIAVDLPEAAVGLPASAFVVSIQKYPAAVSDDLARGAIRFERTFVILEHGWRLEPDTVRADRVTLVLDSPGDNQAILYNVRLEAVPPMPPRLESRDFALPAEARIELGYGLTNPSPAPRPPVVHFRASLRCAGTPERQLAEATVDARRPGDAGWHDVTISAGPRAGPCRLSLAATSAADDPGAPVWAVPRIVAPGPRPGREARPTSLLLISLDTLRGDHLSSNGYARSTTPQITRLLAARGSSFTDAASTYPQTNFAHLSMLTGLYPAALPRDGTVPRDAGVRLLAEVLRDAGFETAAVTEDALVGGNYGFWFGFDRFTERTLEAPARGRATFADGVHYLRRHRQRRFFLWLHTYKTHAPYIAADRYNDLFAKAHGAGRDAVVGIDVPAAQREAFDQYDRAIRDADDQVGRLIRKLDRLGLRDRTLVVLTSDHGEAFGEHGVLRHGLTGHQEELHVPLIIRGPGVPVARRVDESVSLVDLVPTLLDLLGLPALPEAQGVSLTRAFRGAPLPRDRPLYFEWLNGGRGVRFGSWKFTEGGRGGMFFNLRDDPHERSPLEGDADLRSQAAAHLTAYAADAGARNALGRAAEGREPPAVSDRQERMLKALGYVQ